MDFAHDGMSFAIPDSVNGDTPDDILNEGVLVQLQSVANTAEAIHSLLIISTVPLYGTAKLHLPLPLVRRFHRLRTARKFL